MTCTRVPLPGGGSAIVCGPRKPAMKCSGCGHPAKRLCDWKTPGHRNGTCDAPVCDACSLKPAPEKDICPAHRSACEQWIAERLDRETETPE